MILRTHVIICDECRNVGEVTDISVTARERQREAREAGWRFRVEDGERMHLCPDCAPKQRRPRQP